jgi:hypothetical protein
MRLHHGSLAWSQQLELLMQHAGREQGLQQDAVPVVRLGSNMLGGQGLSLDLWMCGVPACIEDFAFEFVSVLGRTHKKSELPLLHCSSGGAMNNVHLVLSSYMHVLDICPLV